MGKIIGLMLVAAIAWAGWQLHSKGVDEAFGGALAPSAAALTDRIGSVNCTRNGNRVPPTAR